MAQDVKTTLVKSRTERPVTTPKGIESPEMKNKATFVRLEGGGVVPSRSGRAGAEWWPLLGSHQ